MVVYGIILGTKFLIVEGCQWITCSTWLYAPPASPIDTHHGRRGTALSIGLLRSFSIEARFNRGPRFGFTTSIFPSSPPLENSRRPRFH